ncbi:MAG: hypothetical protein R3258_04910 [Acidimicrobiia bacterium]|nr:hypothetical protein [Acidimicrobiia bacterium]
MKRGSFRFLLVGSPVGHSLSPLMHAAAMDAAGITGTYEVLDTGPEGLERTVEALRVGELQGVNVTMPLKDAAFRLADEVTPEARCARAVNSLRFRGGKIEGHSTDVSAMSAITRSRCHQVTEALVLGGGGAARAVLCALGDVTTYVSARDRTQAESAAAVAPGTSQLPWGSGVAGAMVVNATPLGMGGEDLPGTPVSAAGCLVDLSYASGETPAMARARRSGIPVVDGVEFLSLAAAASLAWWTGAHVDSAVMLEAARNTQDL